LHSKHTPKHALIHALKLLQWKELRNSSQDALQARRSDWHVAWLDTVNTQQFKALKPGRIVNQFPGIEILTQKHRLASLLNRARRLISEIDQFSESSQNLFDFLPESFVLPLDYSKLQRWFTIQRTQINSSKVLIVKPVSSCEGRGIQLLSNLKSLKPSTKALVQQYISSPLLLNNRKFDVRLYLLISSIRPLRLYLFRDGLIRLAREEYENIQIDDDQQSEKSDGVINDKNHIHLTNYALNKFVKNENEQKIKLPLSDLQLHIESLGHKWNDVWQQIKSMLIIPVLFALPHIQYETHLIFANREPPCYQLLGVDVMITDNFKCHLIEVNRNPSMQCDNEIDENCKINLIQDTLNMIKIKSVNTNPTQKLDAMKKSMVNKQCINQLNQHDEVCWNTKFEHEQSHLPFTQFEQIYPSPLKYGLSINKDQQNQVNTIEKLAKELFANQTFTSNFSSRQRLSSANTRTIQPFRN